MGFFVAKVYSFLCTLSRPNSEWSLVVNSVKWGVGLGEYNLIEKCSNNINKQVQRKLR